METTMTTKKVNYIAADIEFRFGLRNLQRFFCILDDSAYWIEGTTGEEIRSAYRGQQVHVLCLKTLLHPKITNLPPHVQA